MIRPRPGIEGQGRAMTNTQRKGTDLGDVLLTKFNDPDKALAAFKNCYEERVSAASKGDNDAAAKHDIAWALNKQGDVAVRQDREDDALVLFTKARDQIAQLGDELLNNILWPDHLALIDNNIGLIYRDKAAYRQAIDNFTVAEAVLDRVISRDPKDLFRRNSLSWTYYIRAEAQFRWALADHSVALLKQSHDNLVATVEHYSDVIKEAPDKVQWQIGRVGAQANLDAVDGFLAQWAGSDPDAAEDFAKAADLFVSKFIPLIEQIQRPDFVADTVEFLDWAGVAAEKVGKLDEARSDLSNSRATLVAYRSIMGERNFTRLEPRIEDDLSEIAK